MKERSIWKNLLYALAATPMVSFIGLIIITLIGALDDAITNIQRAGDWCLILIGAYIISLIYLIYEPKVKKGYHRKKVVEGLILYWEEQLEKQNKPFPSESEIEFVREELLARLKVFGWLNAELWNKYYPEEKYTKYPFEMVDNFMVYLEGEKKKWKEKRK